MAIRFEDEYVNSNPADANYPEGSAKNTSTPTSTDGSPLEKAWVNDLLGILQKLIDVAGITPSGTPDTVLASEYFKSLSNMVAVGNYAADTGAADAYVISVNWDTVNTSTVSELLAGSIYSFLPANANTGASTINVNGLGVETIKRSDGEDLQPGDITTSKIAIIMFDGTNFILQNPQKLAPEFTLVSKTANYTASPADRIILVDASAGAITITLPTAVGIQGKPYTIKKIDSSNNNVTVDGDGAETIDGATTYLLYAQNDFIEIISDNSNWKKIGEGFGSSFYIGSFTRDISLASGTQAITGVGFKPKAISFIAIITAVSAVSWGNAIDPASEFVVWQIAGGGNQTLSNSCIYFAVGGGDTYNGDLDSLDDDGFTIDWVKTGTPTGTGLIHFKAER
jgi:hypothetical protein